MIAWEEHGAGPAVMFLHGVGLDREMWRRCHADIRDAHRVVLADLPGHGASAPAPPDVTLGDLAATTAAAITEPVHLVGFSLGALVAAELALSAPERVRSLTLVNAVANRSDEERAAVRDRLRTAGDAFEAGVERSLDRWFSPSWTVEEPELREEVRATLLGTDRSSYLACYRVFAEADAELWPRLPAITAPTLAITGSDDSGSTPAMTRALAARIPRATAVVVDGARHLLPLERPAALMEPLLRHIRSTDDHSDH
ncbi:MAG: (E)-2-((N-methylformamido)methylene)succinate hydrolase [Solirubrobacteraceae bacterium]|nr:(E)-2-((N-methylformamido)methylene)succinate hydrolase [Solirubrobacteraceae bacterium]